MLGGGAVICSLAWETHPKITCHYHGRIPVAPTNTYSEPFLSLDFVEDRGFIPHQEFDSDKGWKLRQLSNPIAYYCRHNNTDSIVEHGSIALANEKRLLRIIWTRLFVPVLWSHPCCLALSTCCIPLYVYQVCIYICVIIYQYIHIICYMYIYVI